MKTALKKSIDYTIKLEQNKSIFNEFNVFCCYSRTTNSAFYKCALYSFRCRISKHVWR